MPPPPPHSHRPPDEKRYVKHFSAVSVTCRGLTGDDLSCGITCHMGSHSVTCHPTQVKIENWKLGWCMGQYILSSCWLFWYILSYVHWQLWDSALRRSQKEGSRQIPDADTGINGIQVCKFLFVFLSHLFLTVDSRHCCDTVIVRTSRIIMPGPAGLLCHTVGFGICRGICCLSLTNTKCGHILLYFFSILAFTKQ